MSNIAAKVKEKAGPVMLGMKNAGAEKQREESVRKMYEEQEKLRVAQ